MGEWDRELLECATGAPRQVRQPDPQPVMAGDKPNPAIEIEREDGAAKGRYRIRVDGAEAILTYTRIGTSQIILDHTEVAPELRGRKLGELLVQQAIEDARAERLTVIPLCPYAKRLIDKHPEWHDVLRRSVKPR
jgi:predicted GNAT family acetyltransferase